MQIKKHGGPVANTARSLMRPFRWVGPPPFPVVLGEMSHYLREAVILSFCCSLFRQDRWWQEHGSNVGLHHGRGLASSAEVDWVLVRVCVQLFRVAIWKIRDTRIGFTAASRTTQSCVITRRKRIVQPANEEQWRHRCCQRDFKVLLVSCSLAAAAGISKAREKKNYSRARRRSACSVQPLWSNHLHNRAVFKCTISISLSLPVSPGSVYIVAGTIVTHARVSAPRVPNAVQPLETKLAGSLFSMRTSC